MDWQPGCLIERLAGDFTLCVMSCPFNDIHAVIKFLMNQNTLMVKVLIEVSTLAFNLITV